MRGQSDLEGLLEVCVGETWSRVYWCDYWNSSEASASVVCRRWDIPSLVGTVHLCNLPPPIHVPSALVMYLLLVSGASASSEPFSNDTSSIRPLKCVGTESKLLECSDNFDQGCGVSDMVKVHCQPYCEFV